MVYERTYHGMVYERTYGSVLDFLHNCHNYIPVKPIVTETGRELPRKCLHVGDRIIAEGKIWEIDYGTVRCVGNDGRRGKRDDVCGD